ncbi:MAG: hypothetical protein ACRCY9_22335 [Phycicoccus sp.]
MATDLGPAVDDRRQDADAVRLGPVARAWRAVVVVVLAVGFAAGSLVGDDHWWPFAPWRMFSTSTPPGGAVVFMSIEVRTGVGAPWRPAGITPETVGLNRAEVEGRIPQIVADPSMLGTLAGSHARLRPDDPRWSGVRLVRNAAVLEGRAPTGEVRQTVLATWTADLP